MKKNTHGGAGRNQGLRKGTYKNALKDPKDRLSEKHQVAFYPAEEERLRKAMVYRGDTYAQHFLRAAVLNFIEWIERSLTDENSEEE